MPLGALLSILAAIHVSVITIFVTIFFSFFFSLSLFSTSRASLDVDQKVTTHDVQIIPTKRSPILLQSCVLRSAKLGDNNLIVVSIIFESLGRRASRFQRIHFNDLNALDALKFTFFYRGYINRTYCLRKKKRKKFNAII